MALTKYFYSYDSTSLLGRGFVIVEVSRLHSAPHSVGLPRSSDQLVTETYTQQNTILTLDRHLRQTSPMSLEGFESIVPSKRAAAYLTL